MNDFISEEIAGSHYVRCSTGPEGNARLRMLGESTDIDFWVTFANGGAEAVLRL